MADEVIIVQTTQPVVRVTAPGPQGNAAQVFYTHTQAVASAVWTINLTWAESQPQLCLIQQVLNVKAHSVIQARTK